MRLLQSAPLLALVLIACNSSVADVDVGAMSGGQGEQIARDSLTGVGSSAVPCCRVDSAGVGITITDGTIAFFRAAQYADSTPTPDGYSPAVCVQGVDNNGHLDSNNLVTLENGTSYLLLPCSLGYYDVTLTEQLDFPDGSSTTRQVTASSGAYSASRNRLSFAGDGTASATATLSGAAITVAIAGRQYRFLAVADQ